MTDILVCRMCLYEWRFNGMDYVCPRCGSTLVSGKR